MMTEGWGTDGDGLVRVAPESVGVGRSEVRRFLAAVSDAGCELHSYMIYRGGGVLAEGWWWPYRADRVQSLHSATKGFTATGVGLAVAEGRFSLDDRVVDFFPGHVPADVDENLGAMRVVDLLTQTSGHAYGISGAIWRNIATSWIDEFFKIPVPHTPGGTFIYSSATSFMLSAIVSRTTGQNLSSFMGPRFFEPLDITRRQWDVGPEDVNPGGNGLSCTTADLLKLGIVHLHGGRWGDTQILDPGWVEAATGDVHGHGYGYHWWLGPDRRSYLASGAFGQYAIVFPDHDAVLALTAAVDAYDVTLLPIVWEHFPAMFGSVRLAPVAAAGESADGTSIGVGEADEVTTSRLFAPLLAPMAASVSGRTYQVAPNIDGVRQIRLDFEAGGGTFTVVDVRGEHHVTFGLGGWKEGWTTVSGGSLHHGYEPDRMRVVAGGTWIAEDTFEMIWQFVESPFRDTVTLHFAGQTMTFDRRVNVNSGETTRPTLSGVVRTSLPDQE